VELVEYSLLLAFGEAGTVIGDGHDELALAVRRNVDLDRRSERCVLDCIVEQISEHPANQYGIEPCKRWARIELDVDAAIDQYGPHLTQRCANALLEWMPLKIPLRRTGL